MKHDLDYIFSYYRWREEMLKPITRFNWKSKGHFRYLSVSKASVLKYRMLKRVKVA